jgi:cell wall-associated NlpC family hydrolase
MKMTAPTRRRCPRTARATGLVWLVLAVGCATASSSRRNRAGGEHDVNEVLETARAVLEAGGGEVEGQQVPRRDCSGFVRAIYRRAGIDLFADGHRSDNGVRAIARYVDHHGQWRRSAVPVAGDLVFFDNSYDRNGDGKLNDRFTHVGIVDAVSGDGTAMIIHASNHGIVREPMNLFRPHDATDEHGHAVNAALREKGPRDSARTPHLMSELFAGFGSVSTSPSR